MGIAGSGNRRVRPGVSCGVVEIHAESPEVAALFIIVLVAAVIGAWVRKVQADSVLARVVQHVHGERSAVDRSTVVGELHGRAIMLSLREEDENRSTKRWTEISCSIPPEHPLTFAWPGTAKGVGEAVGERVVVVGDREAEPGFVVVGRPAEVVRRLFTVDVRGFLRRRPEAVLRAEQGDIVLTLPGWPKHPPPVIAALELVAQMAAAVPRAYAAEGGAAWEDAARLEGDVAAWDEEVERRRETRARWWRVIAFVGVGLPVAYVLAYWVLKAVVGR